VNFFERQEEAKGRTTLLVILFVIAVTVVVAATTYAVRTSATMALAYRKNRPWVPITPDLERRITYAAAGATLALILGGTIVRLVQLGSGGASVARMLGGRRVSTDTRDPDERKLLNVVEEMSIASGTPVPVVFLLDEETAINAFAAGSDPGDAVVGVTKGAIERLDRDELQGVIAHEFSHILNGDMKINVRLMGVVFGLLVVALAGRFLVEISLRRGNRSSGGRDKGGVVPPILAVGVALLVIGYLGVLLGRLIKAAISRQREHLADASAVEWTRNAGGLAGALRKIALEAQGARLHSPRAEEASHLFFGDAIQSPFLAGLFATHPPLAERITRITGRRPSEIAAATGAHAGEGLAIGLAGGAAGGRRPDAFVGRAGLPAHEHVEHAGAIIARLPAYLREAAQEPFVAQALAYALLLSHDEEARRRQLAQVEQDGPPGLQRELLRLGPEIRRLGPGARLPLMDLALPALRSLPKGRLLALEAGLERVAAADPAPSVFAFTLGRALDRHLRESHERRARTRGGSRRVIDLGDEARTLLGALAAAGHEHEEDARAAFSEAAASLELPTHAPALAGGKSMLEKLGTALERLATLVGGEKRLLLEACARMVAHDGKVHAAEAELVRAIADALGCPVPPIEV